METCIQTKFSKSMQINDCNKPNYIYIYNTYDECKYQFVLLLHIKQHNIIQHNIQLMRNNIAFRLTAQNSLNMNQIPHNIKQDKNMMNTFKAGSDLRSQLNKAKQTNAFNNKNNNTYNKSENNTGFFGKKEINELETSAQQVAALDHFKAPVSRDKTKNMIQNIKLRRRQKHIDALNRFKEDVSEYKQTLVTAYQSLVNDIEQVLSIKMNTIQEFLNNYNKPQTLLSKQKQLVSDVQEQFTNYRIQCETKLNFANQQLNRISNDRSQMAGQICQSLSSAIIEIAFILQPEAKQIQNKQREDIKICQKKYFQQYNQRLNDIIQSQKKKVEAVETHKNDVIKSWRTLKQNYQIQRYMKDAESDQYRVSPKIRNIFNRLINQQMNNHQNKVKLLKNLAQQSPDSLGKLNMVKIRQSAKKINQIFDQHLDQFLADFKQANDENKSSNIQRLENCRSRLVYFQNRQTQEVDKLIQQKCQPVCKRNIQQQQNLIKNATNYAENQDQKQNIVMQQLIKFIQKIAVQNDDFIKQFGSLNTKYEIQKAKILDEDEELVQKLNEQLNALKKQLKQALHHIKLQDLQKKCFQKVDEIQKAYRLCHQKNKLLKDTRTPSINEFMKKYEAKLAQIFQLYTQTRRAQLENKNKLQIQQQAKKKVQLQEKKRVEEQQKAIQQAKSKGGKAPAPKPKDPKKAAIQLEERKKAIITQLGTKKIEQFKTQSGSIWLVFKSMKEICSAFYLQANKHSKANENTSIVQQNNKQGNQKAIDQFDQVLNDCRSNPVVNEKSYLTLNQIIPLFQKLRESVFEAVQQKKQRIISQSQKSDNQMLEQSLINLDNRLKAHYSLKGTIQSQIFVRRSGQITGHKKKYEKYARTIKQKMDLQTQKFNFLLQKGLQSLKNHISQQKTMKQHIIKCKNLSQIQGLYSRTKQNSNNFGLTIKQIYNELNRFCTTELDIILKKNQDFIKQSKLMKDGGDYSQQQLTWYEQMMNEITNQMKQQQKKRQQKLAQLKQHSDKKKQELLQAFEKEYNTTIQDIAARDGTGKKYGRPKRLAQQKTRLQMNKCQDSQLNINKMIGQIANIYQKQVKNNFKYEKQYPDILGWRKKLMTIQFCIIRYAKHIQAIKPDIKINQMIRVNYNMKSFDPKINAVQEEQDKKRKDQQLKYLGKLSQQKDDRAFLKYIEQIEKIISQQSRTIYVGDKAKYLTGADKIPDFLRNYIANMKKSCQIFKISCIRELRQASVKFSDLSSSLSQVFFSTIVSFYKNNQQQLCAKIENKFVKFSKDQQQMRSNNLKKLRPNLSNPKCQQELKQLDQSQKTRNQQYVKVSQQINIQFKDEIFKNSQQFLCCLLNNYQFLMLLTDSMYLAQDFPKLPGDQIQDKDHLQTHKLMIMKQKGIKIDTTSQRNIRKKWDGLDYSIFNIQNRKFQYKTQQVPKDNQKQKKGTKKDTKDAKKQQQAVQQQQNTKSKVLQTFKTWRQKSVYEQRQKVLEQFKAIFDKNMARITSKIQEDQKLNQVHNKKWRQIADSLYIK